MTNRPEDQLPAEEALAREFERCQKEYFDEVDSHFARQDKPRGTAAFESWQQRFLSFIERATPSLVPPYRKTVIMHPATNLFGPTVHQNWKKNKGNAVEALLAQAIQDARAGHLVAPSSLVQGQAPSTASASFVDPLRIAALKSASRPKFDTARLVRLCEEANICFQQECYLALLMLSRSILDHVPPIFGQTSFAQVTSNYSPKSVKASLVHLDESLRNVADSALHTHIRPKEVLPTKVQVNFAADLDVLLGEVVRTLALPM